MSNTFHEKGLARVLIADSEVAYVTFLSRELSKAGYNVVASEITGASALHAASTMKPDVVIMDASLQDMDGPEIAKLIYDEMIAPVIILAAEVTPEIMRRAARAMVFSIIEKPVQIARLIPSIEIAISNWQELVRQTERISRVLEQDEIRDIVVKAKRVLIETQRMSETDAYRLMRSRSMSLRQPMKEIAEAILRAASAPQTLESRRIAVEHGMADVA